jgi:nucleoside phosphorylase
MTSEGTLTEHAQKPHALSEDFPYHDPPHPHVHIGPVAAGDKVRTDDPFAEINKPVRKTLALDMEGAAFYRVMANFPTIPALFVKGVCDYATAEKDDSFHSYAASVSAMYMLSFIRTFITTKRFPGK